MAVPVTELEGFRPALLPTLAGLSLSCVCRMSAYPIAHSNQSYTVAGQDDWLLYFHENCKHLLVWLSIPPVASYIETSDADLRGNCWKLGWEVVLPGGTFLVSLLQMKMPGCWKLVSPQIPAISFRHERPQINSLHNDRKNIAKQSQLSPC
jgi:hypothetical protein